MAKVLHDDARITLGTAEWAVYDAHIALKEAAKEMLWQELVVWRAAEKSSRKFSLCLRLQPTLDKSLSRFGPSRTCR